MCGKGSSEEGRKFPQTNNILLKFQFCFWVGISAVLKEGLCFKLLSSCKEFASRNHIFSVIDFCISKEAYIKKSLILHISYLLYYFTQLNKFPSSLINVLVNAWVVLNLSWNQSDTLCFISSSSDRIRIINNTNRSHSAFWFPQCKLSP